MKPIISVIIPAHNSAKTIPGAIRSIQEQTYPNLEIILVDDNSTDETARVVSEIARTDGRIHYYKLPYDDPKRFNKRGRNVNAGYMARNYGLGKARGEWITFQDADDASLKNRIEIQYDLAKKYGSSHVCVDWQRYDTGLLGKKFDLDKFSGEHGLEIVDSDDLAKLAGKTRGIAYAILGPIAQIIPFEWRRLRAVNKLFFGTLEPYPGAANSPLFRREVTKKVQFRKLKDRVWPSFMGRGADRDFNFQVAETFRKSLVARIPLYLWNMNQENELYGDLGKYIVN